MRVFNDYRFLPAVEHVAIYVVLWLISLIVLVVLLALIVHAIRVRWLGEHCPVPLLHPGRDRGGIQRPALAVPARPDGEPRIRPAAKRWASRRFVNVVPVGNLPVVFTVIAFWAGAGGWIVIMYGALNNISTEVMEAARIDGAGPVQTALVHPAADAHKWISYMGIMSLAARHPALRRAARSSPQATKSVVPEDYSLNQLSYLYAFRQNDFSARPRSRWCSWSSRSASPPSSSSAEGLFERD